MAKKKYVKPEIEVIPVETDVLLKGSVTTEDFEKEEIDWGELGEKWPWEKDETVDDPW